MKYDHPNGEAYPEDEDPGQDLPSTSLGCVGPDGVPAGQTFNIDIVKIICTVINTGLSTKNLANFSDTCFVSADGLCIGSPRLVGGRKAGNSNMREFFRHHAVGRSVECDGPECRT